MKRLETPKSGSQEGADTATGQRRGNGTRNLRLRAHRLVTYAHRAWHEAMRERARDITGERR